MRASKGTLLPLRRLDRHRAGDDRRGEDILGREQPGKRQRGRHLRAVDQRQPLLRAELDRREAGDGKRLRGRHPPAAMRRFADADQDRRQMGERRQVAGGADRALRRHARIDAVREQVARASRRSRAARRNGRGRARSLSAQGPGGSTSSPSSGPEPVQCDRIRFRCSVARSASPIRVPASFPKPVLTP